MVELPCYAVVELPCHVLVILTWLDQVIEVSLNPFYSYLLLRDWAGWRSVVWRRGETYSCFVPNLFWPSWKQLIILTWKDILPESCVASNIGPLGSWFFFMNCAKFQFGNKIPQQLEEGPRTPRKNVMTQIPTYDRTRWIWNSIHQPARQRKHTKDHPKHKFSMNFAHWGHHGDGVGK